MNLLVVSDLHLNPGSVERNAIFLSFLESALQSHHEVVIVGDLFDLWLGWPKLTFSFQVPILQRMRELAQAGLQMSYVEGNRDFGILPYQGSIFQRVAANELKRDFGSHRIYFEHGDLINTKDRQYRLWRKISKNPLSYWMIGCLPSRAMLGIADHLEKKMKQTNLRYKMTYPESEISEFYKRKAAEGYTEIIVGHFHEERAISLKNAEKNVLCYTLPGWEKGFRYLSIPGDGEPMFEEIRG